MYKLRKFTLTPVTVDVFRCLDQLLAEVWDGLDGRRDWPPPKQEQECIAVACLNLLKLQFHSILQRKIRLNCLQPGTTLLASLKNKVVELASNANVLETIQKSAQGCLQVGNNSIFLSLRFYVKSKLANSEFQNLPF